MWKIKVCPCNNGMGGSGSIVARYRAVYFKFSISVATTYQSLILSLSWIKYHMLWGIFLYLHFRINCKLAPKTVLLHWSKVFLDQGDNTSSYNTLPPHMIPCKITFHPGAAVISLLCFSTIYLWRYNTYKGCDTFSSTSETHISRLLITLSYLFPSFTLQLILDKMPRVARYISPVEVVGREYYANGELVSIV